MQNSLKGFPENQQFYHPLRGGAIGLFSLSETKALKLLDGFYDPPWEGGLGGLPSSRAKRGDPGLGLIVCHPEVLEGSRGWEGLFLSESSVTLMVFTASGGTPVERLKEEGGRHQNGERHGHINHKSGIHPFEVDYSVQPRCHKRTLINRTASERLFENR